ncbi:UNVERIFIED_CONTAM: putative ribonuclease H protein [Sesamum calycinum]|uniref:Basic blue protein n=1 Tax=Sesamum calycinum TaxID=2727403 RepID=A0AAW2PNJ7_9LAMI
MPECNHRAKYLGLPFCKPKSKTVFNQLVEKMAEKLSLWKTKNLSRAGKMILIKNVAQSIPVYHMSTFLLPRKICNKMDATVRRFWWQNKLTEQNQKFLALKSWNSVCQPKNEDSQSKSGKTRGFRQSTLSSHKNRRTQTQTDLQWLKKPTICSYAARFRRNSASSLSSKLSRPRHQQEFLTSWAITMELIWKARNDKLHGNDPQNLESYAKCIVKKTTEHLCARTSRKIKTQINKEWTPPPQNWTKVNTDSALKDGKCVAAFITQDHLSFVRSATTAEILYIMHQWLNSEQFGIRWSLFPRMELNRKIRKIWDLRPKWELRKISRLCNGMAHGLAKWAHGANWDGMKISTLPADAKSYTVGDSTGWIFNVTGWEIGKPFKAGDKLVFKYAVGRHNVVMVDKRSYDSCSVPAGAPTYRSGNDTLRLKIGTNYFICGFTGHCQAGMKIAANAAY